MSYSVTKQCPLMFIMPTLERSYVETKAGLDLGWVGDLFLYNKDFVMSNVSSFWLTVDEDGLESVFTETPFKDSWMGCWICSDFDMNRCVLPNGFIESITGKPLTFSDDPIETSTFYNRNLDNAHNNDKEVTSKDFFVYKTYGLSGQQLNKEDVDTINATYRTVRDLS